MDPLYKPSSLLQFICLQLGHKSEKKRPGGTGESQVQPVQQQAGFYNKINTFFFIYKNIKHHHLWKVTRVLVDTGFIK